MALSVAEPELYRGRVPGTFADKMRERRRVDAVVSDLAASSRRVATPNGLITLVDAKFLHELLTVTSTTGERIYAVVDELHLARTCQVAGLTERAPLPEAIDATSPHVVTAADIKALKAWRKWSISDMSKEFGVSAATISNWTSGMSTPRGQVREQLAAQIEEMRAAAAATN